MLRMQRTVYSSAKAGVGQFSGATEEELETRKTTLHWKSTSHRRLSCCDRRLCRAVVLRLSADAPLCGTPSTDLVMIVCRLSFVRPLILQRPHPLFKMSGA